MIGTIRESTDHLIYNAAASVVRMDGMDCLHRETFNEHFSEIVRYEARSFDEYFDAKGFAKVIDSIALNKVQAYFLAARTEITKHYFIGASIQFMSTITQWNGKCFEHYPAPYFEDVCISPIRLSNFLHDTESKFPHKISLGTHFLQEMVKSSLQNTYGDVPSNGGGKGFIAEYVQDSQKIIRILNKFNATLGQEAGSGIFELTNFTQARDQEIHAYSLFSKLKRDSLIKYDHTFEIRSSNTKVQNYIIATFTNAISSFNGEHILRVQITTNGSIPKNVDLQKTLISMLTEGQIESSCHERGWITDSEYSKFIKMRIHVMNAPEIIFALKAIGAIERTLGGKPTRPMIADFANMPKSMTNVRCNSAPLIARREQYKQDYSIQLG